MRGIFILLATLTSAYGAETGCKLEDWTFSKAGGGNSFMYVEGKTSCPMGTIRIHIYDGEKYLGNTIGHISGYGFRAVMQGKAPQHMTIKYSISDR